MTNQKDLASILDYYGDLKTGMVDYATGPKFEKPLRQWVKMHRDALDQGHLDIQAVVDGFVFNFQFDDGSTLVQRYIKDKLISDEDQVLLAAMNDGFLSFFEILEQDNDADSLRIKCCFSDLEYTLMPTIPGGLADAELAAGSFISSRITAVPGTEVWTPSGSVSVLPAAARPSLVEQVRLQSMEHPEFSHRNPAYRQIALERSQKIHDHFVTAHGGHVLFAPISELVDAYVDAQLAPAPEDLPADQREASAQMLRSSVMDSELAGEQDVMLHSHPLNGLSFYSQAGALREALGAAEAASNEQVELLQSFFEDDTTPAWLLAELIAEQLPASEKSLAKALKRKDFSWEDEGGLFLALLPGEQEPSLKLAIHSEFCRSI